MTSKRRGRGSGLGIGLWMMLAHIFEPKKVVAMEQLDSANRLGREDERHASSAARAGETDG
ncbi:MAG: hypothetical protein ACKVOB_13145, partial [Sphingomonas sp.]